MLCESIAHHYYTVDEAVELLCQEGCQAVHLYIKQIMANTPIELLDGLNNTEKQAVLRELQSIMAVYDRCAL